MHHAVNYYFDMNGHQSPQPKLMNYNFNIFANKRFVIMSYLFTLNVSEFRS